MSKEKETIIYKVRYFGSTSNVIKTILLNKAAAGAVLDSEFENAPSEICDQVRPLFVTPKHPSHPLAARPDLPASVRRSVTQAVLQLGSRGTVPGVLKAVRLSDPVAADYARDYRELEEIDTEKLSSEKPL